MTLKETCNRLYNVALNGRFNGEKSTKKGLYNYVKSELEMNVVPNKVYMVIGLNDGQWFCKVEQYAPGQYDYYIPETREQERRLINTMTKEMQTMEVYVES